MHVQQAWWSLAEKVLNTSNPVLTSLHLLYILETEIHPVRTRAVKSKLNLRAGAQPRQNCMRLAAQVLLCVSLGVTEGDTQAHNWLNLSENCCKPASKLE